MERVNELKRTFTKNVFQHVCRKLNTKADKLSKQALTLHLGIFSPEEGVGDTVLPGLRSLYMSKSSDQIANELEHEACFTPLFTSCKVYIEFFFENSLEHAQMARWMTVILETFKSPV